MTTQLPQPVAAYITATNHHDAAGFIACFQDDAVVNDAGREYRGRTAIQEWSSHEIMAPKVTLEVLAVADRDGEVIVTTKVDGNFDRTGLPNPLLINHHITVEDGKIVRVTCRLVDDQPGT